MFNRFFADERKTNGAEVKTSKAKEPQVKRPEVNLSTAQGVSSSSTSAFQKQLVSSMVVQQAKPALPQQTIITQQEKEKQQIPTQVNTLPQIIVPALPVSKATQQQLQPRFQSQQKIILPQPSPTSQPFSTQSFSQPQQTASQQHVLLQLIKQQDDLHRQNSAFTHDKQQLGAQQAQVPKLLPTTGPSQQFTAHSLSLSYPGFVTFSDPMGASGARVNMMKTTHLTPLSMVSLDSSQTGPKDRAQVTKEPFILYGMEGRGGGSVMIWGTTPKKKMLLREKWGGGGGLPKRKSKKKWGVEPV